MLVRSIALLAVLSMSVDAQVPTLVKRGTIGCSSCGSTLEFNDLRDVNFASNGDILVVDSEAPLLRRFDPTGRPLWSGGRTGEGPGEYQLPLAAGATSDGYQVIDMRLRRITHLDAAGKHVRSVPVGAFVAGAAIRSGGADVVVISNNFRGSRPLFHLKGGADAMTPFGPRPSAPSDSAARPMNFKITIPSIAIAPSGTVAYFIDVDVYRIDRLAADGKPLPPLARTVARVARTPEEREAIHGGTVSMGTAGTGTGSSKATYRPPPESEEEKNLKGHFGASALRYDPSGRLWVKTARGNLKSTIFDIFAADGSFVGSLTVPQRVGLFAVSASTLLTVGENADGLPTITQWSIR